MPNLGPRKQLTTTNQLSTLFGQQPILLRDLSREHLMRIHQHLMQCNILVRFYFYLIFWGVLEKFWARTTKKGIIYGLLPWVRALVRLCPAQKQRHTNYRPASSARQYDPVRAAHIKNVLTVWNYLGSLAILCVIGSPDKWYQYYAAATKVMKLKTTRHYSV